MRPRRVAITIVALLAAITVGHNVNVYHGSGQLIGVTWGTAVGTEIDYGSRGITWDSWTGDRD